MRPILVQAGAYSAANAAGVAGSQIPSAGVAWTLTATPVVVDTTAIARRVVLTAGSEASNRLVTITGTSRSGQTQSEVVTITASTAGTYGSALDYVTVTSIVSSTSFTAAVTAGTIATGSGSSPDVGSSTLIRLDDFGFAPVAVQADVTNGTGSITYQVETSLDDPNVMTPNGANAASFAVTPASMQWVADTNLTGKTATAQDAMVARASWARVTVTAYTGNAYVTCTFSQAGGKWG